MHWYLVHTKPRQESLALQHLQLQGYACYLPLINVEKLKKGQITICTEPLFPRYLFIQLGHGHTAQSWAPIRSTRGVSRLVTFGSDPQKVDDALVEALRKQEALIQQAPAPLFNPGEEVQITDGAFAGLAGVYQMTDGEQRAMVLIELLSKPVKVQISPVSLQKLS
ncbi:transcription/translation regulatory transformer protein RfaH [Pusillimonas minor]|uniref:Transcription antitermination protein RfaH n=1 Tax=Pusillimonas minor TaxID=2697024 RepID=A0A842HQK9_9BURK|nr:transcription/translation regulatory transformer protein RfaH [Pusillimonas minor]MBC2770607.1 transcription/translation regulatory transformer protein RfaH [Pusillimonas minor]